MTNTMGPWVTRVTISLPYQPSGLKEAQKKLKNLPMFVFSASKNPRPTILSLQNSDMSTCTELKKFVEKKTCWKNRNYLSGYVTTTPFKPNPKQTRSKTAKPRLRLLSCSQLQKLTFYVFRKSTNSQKPKWSHLGKMWSKKVPRRWGKGKKKSSPRSYEIGSPIFSLL